jgi:ribonuclease HI
MPWVRAKLRGQVVFARATSSGALASEGGRVEIRYNKNDGRLYRAGERNLEIEDGEVFPDDVCGPADEVERADKAKATAKKKKTSKRRKKTASVANPPTEAPKDGAIAYTDGACSGNPGPAGLGVVVLSEAERIERYEYLGHATNNVAELTAILRALEEIDRKMPATILTDSQYAIGVLQKGWKAKANKELIATLRDELVGRSVKLVYVKGHAGIELNERADELARQAVEERGDGRIAASEPKG